MYAVAPPPTAAAAAAALHLQGLAAAAVANSSGSGLQMFPPTSNSNHFNLAGGPLYQFGTAGLQLAPLLPNPPATQAQLQAAAAVQQAHAAAAANHNAMTAAIFGAGVHQGPILRNRISAEKFSEIFFSFNLGQIFVPKQQKKYLSDNIELKCKILWH
jgi:hypothetical protein